MKAEKSRTDIFIKNLAFTFVLHRVAKERFHNIICETLKYLTFALLNNKDSNNHKI